MVVKHLIQTAGKLVSIANHKVEELICSQADPAIRNIIYYVFCHVWNSTNS